MTPREDRAVAIVRELYKTMTWAEVAERCGLSSTGARWIGNRNSAHIRASTLARIEQAGFKAGLLKAQLHVPADDPIDDMRIRRGKNGIVRWVR